MQSLHTDFISPMEMKLRGEKQNLIVRMTIHLIPFVINFCVCFLFHQTEHKVYRVESGKRRVVS